MQHGHICAAGIEFGKSKRIRPVAASPLSARLLADRGGIFGVGRVIDLGRTSPRQSKPEVEDVRFEPRDARVLRTLAPQEFIDQLRRVSAPDFNAIGPDLVRREKNLVVPAGRGKCSLVTVRTDAPVELYANANSRLRLRWHDGVELPITDVRLYEDDLQTPDRRRLAWLQEELRKPHEVFLCFGLGRPFEELHWLQLNNIHLSDSADWPVQ